MKVQRNNNFKIMAQKSDQDDQKNKRLLVVEDDPFLSDIYNTKLKQAGFAVDLAMTGEECVQKLSGGEYDLMVLDIVLPQLDGWEVLGRVKEMRAKNSEAQINRMKIIILSNLGQKEEIKKGLDLGADGFMIKAHFTPGEVAQEIEKALNAKN